jgi:hypothetical protein
MNTGWLAQLAPEHAPPPPGWWPPAPGWWMAATLAAALAAALVLWWRDPRRRLRRAALAELRAIRARAAPPADTARALENLLRRYALAVFGADATARLTGDAWLAFVRAHGGVPADGAADGWGSSLLAACFGGAVPAAAHEAWFGGAERFLRQARRRGRSA